MDDALSALRARINAAKAKAELTGIPFCPHKPTPPQAAFLALIEHEAFYGGAAGGGKSDCLLMDHLRWADRPKYQGLILRRTLPDLSLPGAIMDRAKSWLIPQGVHWNDVGKVFRFPSGARLQFGFCETDNDVFRYQGAEFHRISIDEVTQWREKPYRYLMSRTRRSKRDEIPLAMRSAGNPGGIGHKWVKARFVDPRTRVGVFVPAKLEDNPHLNVEEYASTLDLLDDVTRAQLRDGKWIDDGAGLVYSYDDERNGVDELPDLIGWNCIIVVDFGTSEIKPTTGFAVVLWSERSDVTYVARAWKEAGLIPSTCAERVKEVMTMYPEALVVADEGALGKGYASEMRQRHGLPVYAAVKSEKVAAIRFLNGDMQQGKVRVLRSTCSAVIEEWGELSWHPTVPGKEEPSQPNHCADAVLYGHRRARAWASDLSAQNKPPPSEEDRRMEEERERWRQRQADPMSQW